MVFIRHLRGRLTGASSKFTAPAPEASRSVPAPGGRAGVRNRGVILYTISSLPYQALSHVVSDPTGQINTIVLVTMANHATVSSGLGKFVLRSREFILRNVERCQILLCFWPCGSC